MADFARGQLLANLREGRHLSQEDAAHGIGVTTKTLRAWEHGGKIRWENAKRVAAFYDVEPERLVSRELATDTPPAELWGESDSERLKEVERKIDEILERLTEPDESDAVLPGPLPGVSEPPTSEPAPAEDETARGDTSQETG